MREIFPWKFPTLVFSLFSHVQFFIFIQIFNLLQYLGFGANRSQAVNRSSQNILWLSCYRIQALIHSYIILFHSFIYFSFVHSLVHSFAHLIFFFILLLIFFIHPFIHSLTNSLIYLLFICSILFINFVYFFFISSSFFHAFIFWFNLCLRVSQFYFIFADISS